MSFQFFPVFDSQIAYSLKMKFSVLLNPDSNELSFIFVLVWTHQTHLPNQGCSTFGECNKVILDLTTIFGSVLQFVSSRMSDNTAQHWSLLVEIVSLQFDQILKDLDINGS